MQMLNITNILLSMEFFLQAIILLKFAKLIFITPYRKTVIYFHFSYASITCLIDVHILEQSNGSRNANLILIRTIITHFSGVSRYICLSLSQVFQVFSNEIICIMTKEELTKSHRLKGYIWTNSYVVEKGVKLRI